MQAVEVVLEHRIYAIRPIFLLVMHSIVYVLPRRPEFVSFEEDYSQS